MSLIVLIPCKNLDRGKSRLAGCLAPRARRALCEFFLCRTLDVTTRVLDPKWVRVVTGDPRVAALAADFRVASIADDGADLNGALARGRARVLAEAGDCAALILPTDLPLATPAALSRLVEARDDTVIVPDEAAVGTNVLRLGRRALRRFRFAYGPQSYRRHCAAARALGFSLRAVHDPVLKFDVDGPDEYGRWLASV